MLELTYTKWQRKYGSHLYAFASFRLQRSSSSPLWIGMLSMPMLSMAKLINTCCSERRTPVKNVPLSCIISRKLTALDCVRGIFHYCTLLSSSPVPFILVPHLYLPNPGTVHFSSSFCIHLVSFSHLIQGGLAHWELFDPQSRLIWLQLIEDISHPSWSNWYMVFYHTGVLVLFIGEESTGKDLKESISL